MDTKDKAILSVYQSSEIPPSYREVGRRAKIAHSQVHKRVARMINDGLLRRAGMEGTARSVVITTKGESTLEQLSHVKQS